MNINLVLKRVNLRASETLRTVREKIKEYEPIFRHYRWEPNISPPNWRWLIYSRWCQRCVYTLTISRRYERVWWTITAYTSITCYVQTATNNYSTFSQKRNSPINASKLFNFWPVTLHWTSICELFSRWLKICSKTLIVLSLIEFLTATSFLDYTSVECIRRLRPFSLHSFCSWCIIQLCIYKVLPPILSLSRMKPLIIKYYRAKARMRHVLI